MKTDSDNRFLAEVRACAMQMMENACYIQTELPSIDMPESLREQIAKLCTDLIGTKHDLIHEVFELDEIMAFTPESPAIVERIERMRQWIFATTQALQANVEVVQNAVQAGTTNFLLQMLVMESAVNILNTTPSAPNLAGAPQHTNFDTI